MSCRAVVGCAGGRGLAEPVGTFIQDVGGFGIVLREPRFSCVSSLPKNSRGLVVRRFVLRDCVTAICRMRANVLCIAKRFWDLMPLRRDQKLCPHLGKAGTAVFAVQEVEYGGHDLTSLFDLHRDLDTIIFFNARDVN